MGKKHWLGSGGGAAAADLGDEAVDAALVAGEAHRHHREHVIAGRPRHLALLAVYELVAVDPGVARPREEDLISHLVAARQRVGLLCGRLLRWRHRDARSSRQESARDVKNGLLTLTQN